MSSLTKLLQEKRKNESTSSVGAVQSRSSQVANPIAEEAEKSETDNALLGQSQFSSSFVTANSAHTATFGESFRDRERPAPLTIETRGGQFRSGPSPSGLTPGSHPNSHGRSKNIPSLSSNIPYSVPNSNAPGAGGVGTGSSGSNSTTIGNGFGATASGFGAGSSASSASSSYLESSGLMPHNVAAIDSNVIASPKVNNVDPRFVISKQKFQKVSQDNASNLYSNTASGSLPRSSSLSSQLGNLFLNKNGKEVSSNVNPSVPTHASQSRDIPNNSVSSATYGSSIPKPMRARQSSFYGSSRQPSGSYQDSFIGSPSSLHEHQPNQYMPRSRHSSIADLKRFFKKGQAQQLSGSPSTPPVSAGGNISSHTSNNSSLEPGSYSSNGDTIYTSTVSPTLPYSKRYAKTGENLGAGAGGSVKLVRRVQDSKVFAVKEFRTKFEHENKRDYVKKITSEYCIGTTLRHANIIETVEIVYDNNRILQVMEYCDYDLFAIVMSNKMSYEEICCCFKQILTGISYLHSMGLAHRDLKLDNCVINKDGIVKLIDFGAAAVFSYPFSKTLVESSGIVGSDPYLAPEVCIFSKYDPRPVDIWSAAIIFACMILKKFPWKIPKLKDNSFKLFCSGRNCDSLSALVVRTPQQPSDPPAYENVVSSEENSSKAATPPASAPEPSPSPAPASNNPVDPGNPNIGPQRLLHSLPEESQHIIGRMVDLAPACRASIDDIMRDSWIESIDMCDVVEEGFNIKIIQGANHKHTQVDQSEAHIAGLEKKKKKQNR
ncbi:LADA_0E03246g1_1 [Lachancea dasiensis]|uniref:non-specific serine/threonine protein kinase n=1 Tax=Lachancea dasiensis TaxID=1072105 RepID=A0A1G4JB60_9SACH|nr:LADA_0E03246g1_1 [Lachancea dasiensis]